MPEARRVPGCNSAGWGRGLSSPLRSQPHSSVTKPHISVPREHKTEGRQDSPVASRRFKARHTVAFTQGAVSHMGRGCLWGWKALNERESALLGEGRSSKLYCLTLKLWRKSALSPPHPASTNCSEQTGLI
jgi:hypothetical protein